MESALKELKTNEAGASITDNELIAQFMGCEREPIRDIKGSRFWSSKGATLYRSGYHDEELSNYSKKWNWLMPVVERIRMISVGDNPENKLLSYEVLMASHAKSFRCSISKHWWQNSIPQEEFICGRRDTTSLIDVTYKSVVQFIKWYNSQSARG